MADDADADADADTACDPFQPRFSGLESGLSVMAQMDDSEKFG